MADIYKLKTSDRDFEKKLQDLLDWESVTDEGIFSTVMSILSDVKSNGDPALQKYTEKYDSWVADSVADLEIPLERAREALGKIPNEQRIALEEAHARVTHYANHQKINDWQFTEEDGTTLGQKVTPLDRVGLYVPGGKAAYPSSVIMNAVPAKVAGVRELIMVVPTPMGELNDLVLSAASISGVDRIFSIGGAQAIAALAYGTELVPPVDKIVGPGNIYVAIAKRHVFGRVGIDMVAGPSEILIISDGETNPDWLAMDLFSQAEHDENAQSILICPSKEFLQKVEESIDKLLPTMERGGIIAKALSTRSALIECSDLEEAAKISNFIAPEHLELSLANPIDFSNKITNAGAIFLGRYSSEPLGDYCAGPNHVLPTSRTARFSSPLGVYDFQKRSSLIMATPQGSKTLGKIASVLARGEGLEAHARSAEFRFEE
tara:strand:+ start:12610 stop:13911 length:1302 start_codon:yes stop_codon:yes gene_type:complete